jgi:hypothetical protein
MIFIALTPWVWQRAGQNTPVKSIGSTLGLLPVAGFIPVCGGKMYASPHTSYSS